jgi:hypothetical protein
LVLVDAAPVGCTRELAVGITAGRSCDGNWGSDGGPARTLGHWWGWQCAAGDLAVWGKTDIINGNVALVVVADLGLDNDLEVRGVIQRKNDLLPVGTLLTRPENVKKHCNIILQTSKPYTKHFFHILQDICNICARNALKHVMNICNVHLL